MMAVSALRAPSFKLRKSATAVISDDGSHLVQIAQRVVVWDVPARRVLAQIKVMRNEWHVAISPDNSVIAVKGENGELVFCRSSTGDIISQTPLSDRRDTGGCPQFSHDGRFLFDGSWNGMLRVWEVASANKIAEVEFHGYMITSIVVARAAGTFFAALNKIGDGKGGSRIVRFATAGLDRVGEVEPLNAQQCQRLGWRHIEGIAVDAHANFLVLVLNGGTLEAPATIESLNLQSNTAASAALPSPLHHVRGLACGNDGVCVAAVHESTPGLSFKDFAERRHSGEYSHLHFYSTTSMTPLARWFWRDAWMLNFSHATGGLAVASRDEPGAYLADLSADELHVHARARPMAT